MKIDTWLGLIGISFLIGGLFLIYQVGGIKLTAGVFLCMWADNIFDEVLGAKKDAQSK